MQPNPTQRPAVALRDRLLAEAGHPERASSGVGAPRQDAARAAGIEAVAPQAGGDGQSAELDAAASGVKSSLARLRTLSQSRGERAGATRRPRAVDPFPCAPAYFMNYSPYKTNSGA